MRKGDRKVYPAGTAPIAKAAKAGGPARFHDQRTPEEVERDQRAEHVAAAAEMKALRSTFAHFDADGVCRCVATGHGEESGGLPHSAAVEPGTLPNDIWFDTAAGKVKRSAPATAAVPEVHPVGEPLTIDLPPGVVAEVRGERHKGRVTLSAEEAGRVSVELHGRQRGTYRIEFRTYREERAADYLPIPDQLDLMAKDPQAWRDHVMGVKARFPKPDAAKGDDGEQSGGFERHG